jgi:hypothetical protein
VPPRQAAENIQRNAALKGHDCSRAEIANERLGLQPLRVAFWRDEQDGKPLLGPVGVSHLRYLPTGVPPSMPAPAIVKNTDFKLVSEFAQPDARSDVNASVR